MCETTLDSFTHLIRAGRSLILCAIAMTSLACGDDATEPQPGTLELTVVTTGYFAAASTYGVELEGEASGTIGANDDLTIEGLEAGTYGVALSGFDVGCTGPGTEVVDVPAGGAATLQLDVVCSYETPVEYTFEYYDELDLDSGTVEEDCGVDPCSALNDFHFAHNGPRTYHAVVFPKAGDREIAHLPDVVFEDLTRDDVAGATFGTGFVDESFDPDRVILLTTDMGDTYALGNPVEDEDANTVTFEAARLPIP